MALSSCEAEYMAVSSATQGPSGCSSCWSEIGFLAWTTGGARLSPCAAGAVATTSSAIAMGTHGRPAQPQQAHRHPASLHPRADRAGRIAFEWISTQDQVADILTKTLQPKLFAKFATQLVVPAKQRHTQQ